MSHDMSDVGRLDISDLGPEGQAHLEKLRAEMGPKIKEAARFTASLTAALGMTPMELIELQLRPEDDTLPNHMQNRSGLTINKLKRVVEGRGGSLLLTVVYETETHTIRA